MSKRTRLDHSTGKVVLTVKDLRVRKASQRGEKGTVKATTLKSS